MPFIKDSVEEESRSSACVISECLGECRYRCVWVHLSVCLQRESCECDCDCVGARVSKWRKKQNILADLRHLKQGTRCEL